MGSSDAASPVRAVIFDYGGVLTTPTRDSIQEWLATDGIRPEDFSAALKEWLSREAPQGTPVHKLETGEITAAEFNGTLAARLRTVDGSPVDPTDLLGRLFARMRPEPVMLDLVREIRGNGLRTALLSNSWGNNYPWEDLDGLFEFAVISGEVAMRKPDPRIYHLMLERLGLAARDAVFVDDGAPNIEAAQQLGMRTVLHTDPADTRAQLTELLPAGTVLQEENR